MKTGSCGSSPCALRLDVVAELVDEDQQDDADAEPPAPDERVAADGEEDPEELEGEDAELDERAEQHGDGASSRPRSERRERSCSLGKVRGSGAVTGSRSLLS